MFDDEAHVEFRGKYRAWLEENIPVGWRQARRGGDKAMVEVQRSWLRSLLEGGWAAPHWPKEHGGMGASLPEQVVMYQENARADAPSLTVFGMALVHAAATLFDFGTDEQRSQHLPRILNGDEVWCQGFSEPEAGSDLAAVRTKAVRDGDRYVVNGQKVWSSRAQFADWCLLLARTDPGAAKHKGITYLLLDMTAPGVEVRPIKTLLGSDEFCEIFLTDAEIPVADRVGEENQGWQVAQATLTAERGLYLLPVVNRLRQETAVLVDLVRQLPETEALQVSQVVAADYSEVKILDALINLTLLKAAAGESGPESSILKLMYSELAQRITAHGLEVAGLPAHTAWDDAFDVNAQTFDGSWTRSHYSSWAWTIGGGTSEIQRNVIGERVLGLPREPRVEQKGFS